MTKRANWVITADFVDAGGDDMPQFDRATGRIAGLHRAPWKDVFVYGPRDAAQPDALALPLAFVLVDDDDNVYYFGYANERAEFAPLDMYGGPNAGAVFIAYRNRNARDKWEIL